MGENPGRAYLRKFWNIIGRNKYHLLYRESFYGYAKSTYAIYFIRDFRSYIPNRSDNPWFCWYSER